MVYFDYKKSTQLDFIWDISYSHDHFHIFSGNFEAYKIITSINAGNFFIQGPHHSGKSHLANIFQSRVPHANIYDLDLRMPLTDELMLIFYDTTSVNLWTSSYHLSDLFHLPDLRTRFNAMLRTEIAEPDEEVFIKILTKRLNDYGFCYIDDVAQYVSCRVDITYAMIEAFVVSAHEICVDRKLSCTSAGEIIGKHYSSNTISLNERHIENDLSPNARV